MNVSAQEPDAALAERASAGDTAAFDELVVRYQGRVYRLVCRISGETDALDILQEVFLAMYRGIGSFRGDSQFGTWLYRIATNAALTHLRSRTRHPTESLESYLPTFDQAGMHRGTPAELQIAAKADELLDRQFLAAHAQAALSQLPEIYRSAFVLRDLEELSTAEVAEILGVEPASVRQRVHRARLMLRGYLTAIAGGKP
jgi:RNA polymerase sigma-70 factor (ECF subfamily)